MLTQRLLVRDRNSKQMANHFSALKRVRQEERRTEVNRARKSRFRNQVKALRRVLEQKDASAALSTLPETFSLIDRAARLGIIKANAAARYKSRLHLRVKALQASAA
jgi:small subunit ribosomal protein S20